MAASIDVATASAPPTKAPEGSASGVEPVLVETKDPDAEKPLLDLADGRHVSGWYLMYAMRHLPPEVKAAHKERLKWIHTDMIYKSPEHLALSSMWQKYGVEMSKIVGDDAEPGTWQGAFWRDFTPWRFPDE